MENYNIETKNTKELIEGLSDAQKKIALKYFTIEDIYEEINRRTDTNNVKLKSIRSVVDGLKDNVDLETSQTALKELKRILSYAEV